MAVASPINFLQWIEEHRHLLKPPVGNQCIYDGGDFIVMVVGGPNSRKDYHYDEGEELFYQIEGDITVKIIDDGTPRDIHIRQGEMFLLPARVPHSPQRGPNTVGLVIERKRRSDELDGFLWFCERCGEKLYEEYLHVSDIVKQLPPIFERFYGNVENRTCKTCGAVMEPPSPPKA
ncbi:3-hydroxyanthranilate 3,4-dioxygenase [bacterium HR20]|nr:3-hydroxyanthranilate 3,4-dioxygenase [bacterium HR20]